MKIIGHRGAKGLAPENTLKSFTKALEYNVDEVECDARVTKDGIVILEHDDLMQDAGGKRYKVTDHTYAELVAIKPELARLSDVIDYINKTVPLQVEVKPDVDVAPILALLQQYFDKGWKFTDVFIGSSDMSVLKATRARLPTAPLVIIESWSGVRASWRCRKLNTKRISMSKHVLWSLYIRSVYRSGYELCAYTVNDPKKARRMAKYGLSGIFTDYPDLYQAK